MRPEESFLGQPIRSLQTMLRVIAEDDPNHKTLIPDGIYGPETAAAITVFQQLHGLPATGITDQLTWEAVVSLYEPASVRREEVQPVELILAPGQVIRSGEGHPHLPLVQSMLQLLSQVYQSIPSPQISGILDAQTQDALASFQYLSGIPMTGHLDRYTWKHIALHYPLSALLIMNADN